MFEAVGIYSKETTHSAHKQSVRHAELRDVEETQIRRAGHWNIDALTGVYLPREFMRSIAGFPKKEKGYFLSCAQEIPDKTLYLKIWPEANVWLNHMEFYHSSKKDNKMI